MQNPLFGEHINKTAWQLILQEDSVYSIRNANLETLELQLAGGPVWEKHCIPACPSAAQVGYALPVKEKKIKNKNQNC